MNIVWQNLNLPIYPSLSLTQCQHRQGEGAGPYAALRRHQPSRKAVRPAPKMDHVAAGGIFQTGGPREGAGPAVLPAVRPEHHHGGTVTSW
uniref:Uncharacterized protein n=1 Tax=Macrostomum lignano TaxID=282301 RepID=A0A1I8IKB1_9PLAT